MRAETVRAGRARANGAQANEARTSEAGANAARASEAGADARDEEELARRALEGTRFTTYWLDSLGAADAAPSLAGDTDCELLVVGGGFCGLWGAILAKERQPARDVVLIEAGSIGDGASGRPAAIVSTSVMHGIGNTERAFPGEVAELERLGRENLDAFARCLERYGLECDIEWGGEMKVAIGDAALDAVDEEHRLYGKYGHDAVRLDRAQVRSEIRSPLFDGAVWSRGRGGTLHPGKLVRGLKRVALELGVRVFEHTPHLGNRRRGDRVEIATPGGRIVAERVLLATNAFAAGHRRIRSRVVAIRDRVVVTEPLGAERMALVGWRHRQGVYDTRTQLNYMRLTEDDRIVFGGRLGYFFGDDTDPPPDRSPEPYVRLVRAFHRTFPQLAGEVRFSHAWGGPIGLTTRMAVHFQRYHDGRMVFAGGYSGFGVTATRFGARVGLAVLDGEDIPETRMAFARTLPGYVPPEPFRWIGSAITMHALDTVDERGGWRRPWMRLIERMGFPVTS